jgi:hypothetical protein
MQLGAVGELTAVAQIRNGLRTLTAGQTHSSTRFQKNRPVGHPQYGGVKRDSFDDISCPVKFPAL